MCSNRLLPGMLMVMVQVSAAGAIVANGNDSQQESLRDLARQNGGKAGVVANAQMPPADVALLTNSADVIVQGRVTRIEPRLNKDETIVFTFISLRPDVRFLKDTVGGRAPSRPGFTPEFTFFYAGGTVRSDGLEITWQSNQAPNPPLQVGEEVIAFLARREEPKGLQVQFGAYGLLRVQGGKVTSAREDPEERRRAPAPLSSTDVNEPVALGRPSSGNGVKTNCWRVRLTNSVLPSTTRTTKWSLG